VPLSGILVITALTPRNIESFKTGLAFTNVLSHPSSKTNVTNGIDELSEAVMKLKIGEPSLNLLSI
jgi:hypothetical protein